MKIKVQSNELNRQYHLWRINEKANTINMDSFGIFIGLLCTGITGR